MEGTTEEIRRTLSEFSRGRAVENPVELLQRTARLYYSNERSLKEIKRQLSAPASTLVHSSAEGEVGKAWEAIDKLFCKLWFSYFRFH